MLLVPIAGIALIILVLQLLGISPRAVFLGDRKKVMSTALSEEEIHQINFDVQIANAEATQNWREAIRLHYLLLLKELSDRQFIVWRQDKTNHEYELEIQQSSIRKPFQSLTYVFEYVYYGNFEIAQPKYLQLKQEYNTFTTQVKA